MCNFIWKLSIFRFFLKLDRSNLRNQIHWNSNMYIVQSLQFNYRDAQVIYEKHNLTKLAMALWKVGCLNTFSYSLSLNTFKIISILSDPNKIQHIQQCIDKRQKNHTNSILQRRNSQTLTLATPFMFHVLL